MPDIVRSYNAGGFAKLFCGLSCSITMRDVQVKGLIAGSGKDWVVMTTFIAKNNGVCTKKKSPYSKSVEAFVINWF